MTATRRPSASLNLLTLEAREVPASLIQAVYNNDSRMLDVYGTAAADQIAVRFEETQVRIVDERLNEVLPVRVAYLPVTLSGVPWSYLADINVAVSNPRIRVYGQDGHDRIRVDAVAPRRVLGVEMHGGNGNDTLMGGAAGDLLYGEAGFDNLHVMGRDTADGGGDFDTIHARIDAATELRDDRFYSSYSYTSSLTSARLASIEHAMLTTDQRFGQVRATGFSGYFSLTNPSFYIYTNVQRVDLNFQFHFLAPEIKAKFVLTGEANGPLGAPTGVSRDIVGGKYAEFERGAIVWSATTGARSISREALAKWQSLGWVYSFLG